MKPIARRTVLKGLGASLALPLLEGMTPAALLGRESAQAKQPLRLAFLTVPNGAHMQEWTPEREGTDFTLPRTLEPLAPFQRDLMVLTGLTQDNAASHGDGGGDHARSAACFLTGVHPRKTHGANIRVGISVDQAAAQKIGHATRFPSLELGCEPGGNSGNCDSGYSCAYSSNVSWRSDTTPNSKEINPRLVFERLFTSGEPKDIGENQDKRRRYQQSILDFVAQDATRLRANLGGADRQKLDEYLHGVRELELRVTRAEQHAIKEPDNFSKPDGVPKDYQEHVRLLMDLLVLAFQGDLTRINTFMLANEGSNRTYTNLDISDGHHELSHHGGSKEKQEKIAKINRFHIEQFAYLLGKLRAIKEGPGSLLDGCMIVYGSGISDGDRHNHNNLPVLLAGRGTGTLSAGRHLRYADKTPLNNLYLSMLDRVGVKLEHLGDSTGRLTNLEG